VSVLLLTLNEEGNLPRCLDALSWCDDIVVLDSLSGDRTTAIATERGARVITRPFDGFAGQRNHALEEVDFRHDWVFHLDADEVFTPELAAEIEAVLRDTTREAYRLPSKTIFQGAWLRRSGMYPTYQVRLTRRPRFRFRQVGHGQKEDLDPGRIGTLRAPLIHYPFSKGIADWIERHNRYSTAEAAETLRHRTTDRVDWPGLVCLDAPRRRQALRGLSYRLPFRPLARFLYMYILHLGLLDGRAGLTYCRLLAMYEYMIILKVREQRQA
jgi:glycosyltransferase involved in cell wall biosynthesis